MNLTIPRLSALAAVLAALLVSCPTDPPPTDPPPKQNRPPVAAFTTSPTVQAMTALAFDASTSSDPDGDALIYTWEFGDGGRGGAAKIAHVFTAAGTYNVTLTISDGKGGINALGKTVAVSAAPAPSKTVAVKGLVKGLDGAVLAGVSVAEVGGSSVGATAANGTVTLNLGVGVPVTLKLSKDGYADQFKVLNLPSTVATDGFFEASLMPREAPQNLEAGSGGNITGKDGVKLTLGAASLVTLSGAPVAGSVQVSMTPVDVTGSALLAFPGEFAGLNPDATRSPLVSYGTVEYRLTQGEQRLQVAPGKKASLELPIYAGKNLDGSSVKAGDALPLWSLDENTGTWVAEGLGAVVASPASPTGLALRTEVTHFSWWNTDFGFAPFGPKPRCEAAADVGIPGSTDFYANAQICNMLAQFADGAQGSTPRGTLSTQDLSSAIVGFRAYQTVPRTGGAIMPVPAGVNVLLTASALNGTWQGQKVVNGALGALEDVVIELRPVTVGIGDEAITLPADLSRTLVSAQVSRFNFTAPADQWLQVTAAQTLGSGLTGTVRLLRGGAELARSALDSQSGRSFTQKLPEAGQYTLEVTGTAGGYRLQAKLIDVGSVDKLVSVSLADGESTSYSFTGFAGMVVQFYSTQTDSPGYFGRLSLTDPDGQKDLDGYTLSPIGVTRQLTKNGVYTVSLRSIGSAGKYLLTSSLVTQPTALNLASRSDVNDTLGRLGAARFYDLQLGAGDFAKLVLQVPNTLPGTLEVGYRFGSWPMSQSFANFSSGSNGDLFNDVSGRFRVSDLALLPATTAGRYLLKLDSRCVQDCADYATSSFPYSFTVLRPNPVQLAVNTPVTSAFTEPYGLELFKLNVTDPGYYLLYFSPTAPKGPREQPQDLILQAFAPNLTPEGSAYRDFKELIVNLAAGTHTLSVNKRYAEAGPYTLTAIRLVPPIPLSVPSGAVTGSIDLAAQKRYYSLSRSASQAVKVSLSASAGWSGYVRIYKQPTNGDYTNSDNALAVQAFGAPYGNPQSVSFTYTPPSDGTYIVRVNGVDPSGNPQTGSYTLSLETP